MDISKKRTAIWIVIAALWVTVIVLGTLDHFVIGMVLSVPLIALHFVLGTAKKGKISAKFLGYPILIWSVVNIVAFIMCGYFADKFKGVLPTFTILGLDPSFAPVMILYWIGGMLTLSLGFYICRDEWLSEKDWTEFCKRAKKIKTENNMSANIVHKANDITLDLSDGITSDMTAGMVEDNPSKKVVAMDESAASKDTENAPNNKKQNKDQQGQNLQNLKEAK